MAYMYPYGDSQQLNLSWFLAKFKELYEYVMQLDPSGETAMDVILSRFTEQYDSTRTYIPGDYCIYDGYIYKANTTTGGTFDSSAWNAALPVNDVQGLRILLGGLSTDLDALEQNAVTNVQYTPGAATANGLLRQTKNGTAETVMTVDKEPTENSQNPVKSGAVYEELDELNGSITSVNHSITSWDVKTNGKILFLSNSYGNLSSENWKKFPYWCASYLGLGTEGTNWWNCAQPFFSLAHPDSTQSFKKELQDWVSAHASEKANIGAVVVVGGINDSRPTVSGESYARYTKVLEKFEDLISYIKTNLPNATAYCGYTGWIDLVARPTDDRRGAYRLKVAQAYMQATQFGWKYLNGIENIIHNKNYLADGVHPNEAGAKRLGLALAEALSTGSCEIIEWSSTLPTPLEGGSIGNSSKARERQQNGIINTQFNAFQFAFSAEETITASSSHSMVVGNINLKMSTGVVEFGNQIISLGQYVPKSGDVPAHWVEHPCYARIYIADNGDVTIQCKAYCDGQESYPIRRVTSFTISESHAVYADDTWNNTIDGL